MKEVEIYIHFPFCQKKCKYCNFTSYCVDDNIITQYVDKLLCEIETKSNSDYCVTTVFLGGGTPSLIDEKLIEKVILKLKNCYTFSNNCEITIECNPNTTNEKKLIKYLSCGVNRISFGAQTFNDELLKIIGRIHTSNQIEKAVNISRKVGFKNISLDLMIGLPLQTKQDVLNDIDKAVKLGVNHLSCYSLILEQDTPLFNEVENDSLTLPEEDDVVEMYDLVNEFLNKNNFKRYEVSNFCKPGYECKHNLGYWFGKEYLGFGVAAHSYFNGFRCYNTDSIQDYISKSFDEVEVKEYIDKQTAADEYIMLALRTKWGIDNQFFKKEFGRNLIAEKNKQIEKLVELNLIKVDEDRIFALDEGFHLLNKIILELV